uniref:Methyltransferase type 11 domain-containing protein n=2 Tax=Glycine max TaxID=3847 RepID=A0A0R0J672_SOYBN
MVCQSLNPEVPNGNQNEVLMKTVEMVIQKIEEELDKLRETKQDPSLTPSVFQQGAFLSDILGLLESAAASHQQNEGNNQQNEIRKYVRIKPNRLGKQNFMGENASFTSIGHTCFAMKEELEEYMDYDVGEICNDDWKLAQKLMVHGCDPLPRRRCFSRSPKLYKQPFPVNESLWKLPDDRNVRWSQYQCKNFACLAGNATRKGFFKGVDCFNLTNHEMPRWIFLIGLDLSVGTGIFAARMREFNVTIVSANINFGAPFNEMIALRGLVPLYLTINQRLPFFDNTLDLIHTTRFLDGWIDLVLLEFILYDWDRVLRPGGLLWIDSFFCLKVDLYDYLQAFKMLRYKKHKWVVVPKLDKDEQEMFFSAVLEKPHRPFR